MDFSHMRSRYNDPIRRTATDSHISQYVSFGPSHAYSNSDITNNSSRYSDSNDNSDQDSNRKLSPQNAVHMGIKSVQRKIQEQEVTLLFRKSSLFWEETDECKSKENLTCSCADCTEFERVNFVDSFLTIQKIQFLVQMCYLLNRDPAQDP
jgi:hypothetical protein